MHSIDSDIHRRGNCVGHPDPDIFFSDNPAELAAAQAVCAGCDLRAACLELALRTGAEWGVWGGIVFIDGRAYHRKRPRGRPRREERHLPVEASREDLERLVRSA